ncbi:MAG: anti-anti-sigma factor [Desulfovibrionaceae bacterium CG1_02_65_16]|nr:MAG: anti-anti-sigma factor [Desulfovibrionaceae bacterium CG1_02_65_16]
MDFIKTTEGNICILAVVGRMDTLTAPEFEAKCAECAAEGATRIVVDLSSLEYISSAGLRSILASAKKLKALGGGLSFCCLSGIVNEVFAVSGFSKLMPVFPTRQEALAKA